MNKICENIKRLRLERELTQQDIAEKMFVTRQCISRWEQGITLPDIKSIEGLSKVFNCDVNDILDNDSIKVIAINEAIKNKKDKKIIFISIIVSIFAILISIFGFYFLNKENNVFTSSSTIKAIVLEINSDNQEIKLKLDDRQLYIHGSNVFIYYHWESQKLKLFDNKQEEITPNDLKVGDIIEIFYYNNITSENIYEIHVIDSEVEKNFYGVIVVTNGERYETYDDIPFDVTDGIRFYLHTSSWGGSSTTNNAGLFEATSSFSYEEYNNNIVLKKYEFNMNVYFDKLKISEDPVIGLVYSTGIEYVETLSPEYNTARHYEGELSYEIPGDEYLIHSEDVIYNINFNRIFSFSKIEVYEYDINHDLLGVTELYDSSDISNLRASKDSLYAYFKVYSEEKYTFGKYENFETYYLKVGDDLIVNLSDNHGLIWKVKIIYRYNRWIND